MVGRDDLVVLGVPVGLAPSETHEEADVGPFASLDGRSWRQHDNSFVHHGLLTIRLCAFWST
jgi:hypothetical protein